MGYYVDLNASLTQVKTPDLKAIERALNATVRWSPLSSLAQEFDPINAIDDVFMLVAESTVPEPINGVALYGNVKFSEDWFLGIFKILADYYTGDVCFTGEDGLQWKFVLDGRGTVDVLNGVTVYLGDPNLTPAQQEAIKALDPIQEAEITLRIPWRPAQHDHPALWNWNAILGTPRPVTVITKEKA